MEGGDVDTGKFASWPLLRPDELATLPSDVLKASLAALDLLCGQTSDEDAIADYAQRQRERTASILSERAAQVRVRALLTGSTSPGLSMAPLHGLPSTDGNSRRDRRSSSEHETDLASGGTPDFSHGSPGGCVPSAPSPPIARVDNQYQHRHRYQASPVTGTPMATSPLTLAATQGKHTGDKLDASSLGVDDLKRDPDSSTPQACAPERSTGHLFEPDGPGGRSIDTTDATNLGDPCAGRQDMYTGRQDRGPPSFTNVMHEKWGSVFVVGGGQRRRRASVRRRSVEAEDTPATRRAHVDKERQERRKASLCRLLARKEQRALQQETRRKRRAAAARAAAATATAAPAVAEAAASAVTAGSADSERATSTSTATATGEARVTSAATTATTTTTTTTNTASTTSSSATDTTPLPGYRRARSPTNPVNAGRDKHITNGLAPILAPVPASPLPRAWSIDANAPDHVLGASGGNAAERAGNKEVTVRDTGGVLPREGVQQPCGSVFPEDVSRREAEICGAPVYASSEKGGTPDAVTARDSSSSGSSSESESVSGGDSSDDDDLSADEGVEQTNSRRVQVEHTQQFEQVTEAGKVPLGAGAAGSDTYSIADDQRAALPEGHGDLHPSRPAGRAKGKTVTGEEPPQSTTSGMRGCLTPAIPSGPVDYCHEKASAEDAQAVAIYVDAGPHSAADKPCDNDAPPQMTTTTTVAPPIPDITVTSADGSEERSGSGTDSDAVSDSDSGSAGGHDDTVALVLPGPLDVGTPKAGPADGRIARGESRFLPLEAAPAAIIDDMHEAHESDQRLTTGSQAPSAAVEWEERASRRPSDALKDSTLSAGHLNSESGNEIPSPPKDVPTGGTGGFPGGVPVHPSAGGAAATQVRHRHRSVPSMPTTSDGTAPDDARSGMPCSLGGYTQGFPKIGAILSAYHNGRALTRETDCRSLPLTSSIMARGRGGRGVPTGLTATEEEACLHLQLKLYSIYVRVIKDYAAVFSLGDDWPTSGAEDPSSLVYSGDPSALHYRVNSKSRPEVYNIVTDVLNNRCEQWEELPTGLGLKTTWNLLWTWSKPHIQYSSLLVWQKVNHFPNSRELTRKDLLNKHISRFMAPGGRLAKEFHIMPQTFVLPHEFTTFVAAFTSSGHCGRERGKSTRDNDYPAYVGVDSLDDLESREGREYRGGEAGPMAGVGRRDNVWIMKPVGMSRGRGIRLIDDIKNITYADKVVLQRYIGNPLLLDGYKFDLRLYVLVTSFNPLEAFMYKEGFARVSTHLYEKGDIGNPFIHLTNSSVQRLNESGATRDNPLHHANLSEAGGTKTTLSYLWRRLAASGVDVGALWAGICSVVVKSLVCVEGAIPNQPNSFELFGYDVLIDDKLRPWLIEVNASPSMARDNHIDRQVKESLIFDTIHLVDPLPFDRQNLADVLEKRLSGTDTSKSKSRSFIERRASANGFDQRNASAPPFEGDTNKETAARASLHGSRPRRRKDEVELDKDLNHILKGRRPRKVGELPNRMGNFVRLCPATAAHRHAHRLRKRVIRPHPGEEHLDSNQ